jgi:hypothetical protein
MSDPREWCVRCGMPGHVSASCPVKLPPPGPVLDLRHLADSEPELGEGTSEAMLKKEQQ